MALTVQNIVDASSTDFRSVLASTGADANLFVSWVDRIHKDALHTSIYNQLTQVVSTIAVTTGTSSYTIDTTSGQIRRIQLVYDRTFDRVVLPIEILQYPSNQADAESPRQALQIPKAMVTASTMEQWPEYYRREGTNKVILFPAPQKAAFNGTYEIHYEAQVVTLSALTDTLVVPEDGKDMIVAGVNSYVAQFLHLDTEGQYWTQQYEMLKKGQANQ